jgi:predicted Rossmann fold flavoprotein
MTAAQRGRSVLVVDSANKVGKKILMSGGGRCNFTNLDITPENFLCSNRHFVKSALKRYTQWDFIELVNRHAIRYHERNNGELFCDDSAKQILAMLLEECELGGALVRSSCAVEKVITRNGGYGLTINGVNHQCESLVIATGGLANVRVHRNTFNYSN